MNGQIYNKVYSGLQHITCLGGAIGLQRFIHLGGVGGLQHVGGQAEHGHGAGGGWDGVQRDQGGQRTNNPGTLSNINLLKNELLLQHFEVLRILSRVIGAKRALHELALLMLNITSPPPQKNNFSKIQ